MLHGEKIFLEWPKEESSHAKMGRIKRKMIGADTIKNSISHLYNKIASYVHVLFPFLKCKAVETGRNPAKAATA